MEEQAVTTENACHTLYTGLGSKVLSFNEIRKNCFLPHVCCNLHTCMLVYVKRFEPGIWNMALYNFHHQVFLLTPFSTICFSSVQDVAVQRGRHYFLGNNQFVHKLLLIKWLCWKSRLVVLLQASNWKTQDWCRIGDSTKDARTRYYTHRPFLPTTSGKQSLGKCTPSSDNELKIVSF